MNRILLIEDEELIGSTVKLNLQAENYVVKWCTTGRGGLAELDGGVYDLLILDLLLPGDSGEGILKELRARGHSIPVLVLTALGDIETKVRCLEAGADDYLTKPFDIRELSARTRALIRRSTSETEIPSDRIFSIGSCKVNLETREATTVNGGEVLLTEKECSLVELFARNQGRVLSRADIIEEVWGMDESPTSRTVDNFVVRLRRMFEEDPKRPRHFLTVRAVGYRFDGGM
ncbi:MAG: response regulator transcription factor [Deltaproteobacteria bacterium]|nr:response regulator transcription factor [Deltaproteobacteria bacterium]